MDRSFSSPSSIKSPFSPRARQNISSKRVLPPSFRKSSRFSVSGKSTQSVQIVLSTPYNFVERFGQPLPVLIAEALTFGDRNTVVSARISKNGFAWVVCGRRLLIWQYRQSPTQPSTPQKKTTLNQCFELQLPQSDLAHRAELVSVFQNQSNAPSCIAVSPAGAVRYWPAIVHEELSVEDNVKLQGQECESLVDVEGLGCIVATTSCTVLLVQPQYGAGRPALTYSALKAPTGWLGGIGKRMSSFIFGPISSDPTTETGMVRALSLPPQDDTYPIFVLANRTLQKWLISTNPTTEELIYMGELVTIVTENFRHLLWENMNNGSGDQSDIDLWFLDIQSDKNNIIILTAAVNKTISHRLHYAMFSLPTASNEPPTTLKDFVLLQMTDLYQEDNATDALSYRFLLCGTVAYIYNHRSIQVVKPKEDPDTLEFNTPQDFLLAGAICVNTAIFFSRNYGLVAVSSNDLGNDFNSSITYPNTPVETSFSENVVVNNLSIYNMDPEEVSGAYKGVVGQLKAAFIYHITNKEQAYKSIIEEIFPVDSSKLPGIDSLLDKVVLMTCKDLLDDVPAGDPRWSKDTQPVGLGSSYSMQVLHQLEDKQKAHALFIRFLRHSGLWNQLAATTTRSTTLSTTMILGEFSEKIVAALVLKGLPFSGVLEKAVDKCVDDVEVTNGLTSQDLFYREVSRIERGLQELVNYVEDVSHSNMNPAEVVDIINEVNDIVLTTLREILQHRKLNAENYKPSESITSIAPDYLPWTAANGPDGIGDSLSQLHFLTYNYGVLLTHNEKIRSDLMEHLLDTTDFILDGHKNHIESIKDTAFENILFKQYCADRQKLMKPFLQEKEYEKAAKLAEKYLDFENLVVICEATDNQKRLDDYLEKFSNSGFSEYVYNWFLKENKQGKLLDRYRQTGGKSQNIQKLTDFLEYHPSLSWMQNIFDKKYNLAADTLLKLGLEETESVTRQKTMLSLSKLAKLAAHNTLDAERHVKSVQARLDLIGFQEEVPDYVLQQFGYDTVSIRVIPPHDLIRLYVAPEFHEATELEFKKALDLLPYVEDDELRDELSLTIWRNAILKDTWNHSNLDSPIEILENKLFFKLVDIAMILDGGVLNLLPQLDVLLEGESMSVLENNTSFQFLIKTGYEHIYRTHTVVT